MLLRQCMKNRAYKVTQLQYFNRTYSKFNTPPFNINCIQSERRGTLGTLEFELYLKNSLTNQYISPWHDIPLNVAGENHIYHYVHEIGKGERRKMEVNTSVTYNPIKQDVSKGKPREFSYGDLPFNYGCIPQTWEDPEASPSDLPNLLGDNDPVDVVELSQQPLELGKIYTIKILGALALIDQGEVDWKILAIRTDDQIAQELQDIHHIKQKYPQLLESVFHWFKYYKTTDNKPENTFALEGRAMDRQYAIKVIEETHENWNKLIRRGGSSTNNKLWIPSTE
jgi:inorganic pyrophosphatase